MDKLTKEQRHRCMSAIKGSHSIWKDNFADGISHFHRVHLVPAGEDDLSRVVIDAHWKKLTILVHRFLADLGLPVVEVAFLYSDLFAEGPGGHVALKKGLICRPECFYRFHTVLIL